MTEDQAAVRPALGRDADRRSRRLHAWQIPEVSAVEAGRGGVDPHAVRADEAETRRLRRGGERGLEIASSGIDLAEARGKDHGYAHASLGERVDGVGDGRR